MRNPQQVFTTTGEQIFRRTSRYRIIDFLYPKHIAPIPLLVCLMWHELLNRLAIRRDKYKSHPQDCFTYTMHHQ